VAESSDSKKSADLVNIFCQKVEIEQKLIIGGFAHGPSPGNFFGRI